MTTQEQIDRFVEMVGKLPDYCEIPTRLLEALARYLFEGMVTGQFLQAVLRNDLSDAVSRADVESLAALKPLVLLLNNACPGNCHGGSEAILRWCHAMPEGRRESVVLSVLSDGGIIL
jgi:hypothetical protein